MRKGRYETIEEIIGRFEKCPDCGLDIPYDCDVCPYCGKPFEIEKQYSKREKKISEMGTLKHNHVVSPEYYLELKLKEARQNFFSRDKK